MALSAKILCIKGARTIFCLCQVKVFSSIVPLQSAIRSGLVIAVLFHFSCVNSLSVYKRMTQRDIEALIAAHILNLLAALLAIHILLVQVVCFILLLKVEIQILMSKGIFNALVLSEQGRLISPGIVVRLAVVRHSWCLGSM